MHVGDITTIVFLTLLTMLNIIFHARVASWAMLITLNTIASVAIVLYCPYADNTSGVRKWLRDFYMVFGIPLVFKELYLMIQPIHPIDYDSVFIAIDHWMFGVHPTQWLHQFSHPVLTEILQVAYSSFYFLLIIIGIDLYQRKNKDAFEHSFFAIVYGFFLSYLGYLIMPAIGPRFTLHDFSRLNEELPGLFITPIFRTLLNAGESIPDGTLNPAALVQRDVFPSGHTQMTLVVMYLAAKYHSRIRWFLWISGSLLIIGTVYLRYHYVFDLIGGAAFFAFTVWSAPKVEQWWNTWRGNTASNR